MNKIELSHFGVHPEQPPVRFIMQNQLSVPAIADSTHSGMIAFHQKDYGKAIDELKQANQQDPNILYHLALAFQGSGKTDEAKEYATWAAKYNVLPFMNYAYVRIKAEKLLAAL
jgi:tetratricopeptide (TPR) repeat protein